MSQSLLAFDTDRIKSYVFATDMLKEIRGASSILDHLNRKKMGTIVGGKRYYAHGGGGLFLVETAVVEDVILRVQRVYAERTGGAATITGVSVELPADFDAQTDDVREWWKLLGYRLKAAKARNRDYQTSVSHPLFRPGDTDGHFYATATGEEQQLISRVSRLKREENARLKHEWKKAKEQERPERFEDIALVSTPQNYFGLMVADGDSLGQVLERCTTLTEIKALAESIFQTLKEVMQQAAKDCALESNHYDILLLGGDDLVVALPVQKALDFAMRVSENFTMQMQQAIRSNPNLPERLANERFTLSTAVVWAHTSFPFGTWYDLAENALKFTKQQRAIRQQTSENAIEPLINFLVVSSANHLKFENYYEKVLTRKHEAKHEQIIRTMRPYTVSDLRKLVAYRKGQLRNIPRSKLEALRQSVFQPTYQQAMLDALRVLVHWRSEKGKEAVQQLIRERMDDKGSLLFPFIKTEAADEFDEDETMTTYQTPLADLAELWDFLPGGDEDAA